MKKGLIPPGGDSATLARNVEKKWRNNHDSVGHCSEDVGSIPLVFEGMCRDPKSTLVRHYFRNVVAIALCGTGREAEPLCDFLLAHPAAMRA
jgi:hypothetical protein